MSASPGLRVCEREGHAQRSEEAGESASACLTAQVVGHHLSRCPASWGLRPLRGLSLRWGPVANAQGPGRVCAHCWPNLTRKARLVPNGPPPEMTKPVRGTDGERGRPGVHVGPLHTCESVLSET